MKLYHFTYLSNAESIRQQGFRRWVGSHPDCASLSPSHNYANLNRSGCDARITVDVSDEDAATWVEHSDAPGGMYFAPFDAVNKYRKHFVVEPWEYDANVPKADT